MEDDSTGVKTVYLLYMHGKLIFIGPREWAQNLVSVLITDDGMLMPVSFSLEELELNSGLVMSQKVIDI